MSFTVTPLRGIPMVAEGDDLAALIHDAAQRQGLTLADKDVVVVTQKIVSKAEGRVVSWRTWSPACSL